METIHLCLFMMLCLGVHRSSSEVLQRQKRNWIIDSFSIDEGYEGTFPYSLGIVDIEKALTLFRIHGQGVDEEPKGLLKINENTGEITVHGPVDFEEFSVLKVMFQAYDSEKHVLDTQLGIEIKIIDTNDHAPKFDPERYEISIKESTSQGTDVTTIMASDNDLNNNGKFDLKIISVTPEPHGMEFYLTQMHTQTGIISFKGCLDHEKADKYTIIVEAKDHGERKQLSSSCTVIINIEDGNNHLPSFKGQTAPGRVKEREEDVLVSRLPVTDEDTKGTAAWRAKYQIQGDTNNNFRIVTDPETNEGLLYVEKHLDYEESPMINLTISVDNEIPYHSCKVVKRTKTDLWEVVTDSGGATGTVAPGRSTRRVTVIVEDVNEPPIFYKRTKQVTLIENTEPGQYLETFTARDPDVTSGSTIVYVKGDDPADWITVDPVIGKITTSKIVDRESPFVKDNIYEVTIYAVDNGKPPATGTATLSIHITDENDHAPSLAVSKIDMCQSDGHSMANITAMDLDEEPFGGPFGFKLLGDVKDKWRVDPVRGYSVNLVKENMVHSGHYELLLKVSDLQGNFAVHNLSVTVCDCLDTARPNCHTRKATGTSVGGGTLGIIFFGILLLAGMILAAFLVSCKKQSIAIPDDGSGQQLMNCNTEKLGTDCKVAFEPLYREYSKGDHLQTISQVSGLKLKESFSHRTAAAPQAHSEHAISQTEKQQQNYWHQPMGTLSTMRTRPQHRYSMRGTFVGHTRYSADQGSVVIQRRILLNLLNKKLYSLQAQGAELDDYDPHVYAEEGDMETKYELDAIPTPDISFDPDLALDLDFKFNTLASVCMPGKSTAYGTETFHVTETQ